MDYTFLEKLNRKIPFIFINTDLLSFFFQLATLFFAVSSAIIFSVFGLDVTFQYFINLLQGKVVPIGEGIHFTTLFNAFILGFIISVSLSKMKVYGLWNIIAGTQIPFSLMMIFEFLWVVFYDAFHNSEYPWAIMRYGQGSFQLLFVSIGFTMIPTSFAYIAFLLRFKVKGVLISMALGVLVTIFLTSFPFGTLAVFTRNISIFTLVVFADASIRYSALVNEIKFEYLLNRKFLAIFLSGLVLLVVWVLYPLTVLNGISPYLQIKGYWFPQTVYAFYDSQGALSYTIYEPNDMIHFLNIASKFLMTLGSGLILIPNVKKEVDKDG